MTDFSRLNKNPWCSCCTNDQIFIAAEEVCDHIMQKHYMKPMCVGSLERVASVAAYMLIHVVAGKMANDVPSGLLPPGIARLLAQEQLLAEVFETTKDIAAHMNQYDKEWEERFLRKLISVREIIEADEAYDKQSKQD